MAIYFKALRTTKKMFTCFGQNCSMLSQNCPVCGVGLVGTVAGNLGTKLGDPTSCNPTLAYREFYIIYCYRKIANANLKVTKSWFDALIRVQQRKQPVITMDFNAS